MAKTEKKNLKQYLDKIQNITDWFESQEAVDLEEALTKVKEAAELIKASKERLSEIENEFEEIKKEAED